MTDIRALVAGNWKMNGNRAALEEISNICSHLTAEDRMGCEAMICPPTTLIASAVQLAADTPLMIGGQDCHSRVSGAHTGDVSAAMLRDCGAVAVIVGHSERRGDHGEGDALVRAKASAALAVGLTAIVCVGETEGQRRLGLTLEIVGRQVVRSLPDGATAENVIVAYEPVWAIGTGLVPRVSDVAEVHGFVRGKLEGAMAGGAGSRTRILYGGSVKAQNAAELMAVSNVNGALVGGASLKADDFIGILSAYHRADG